MSPKAVNMGALIATIIAFAGATWLLAAGRWTFATIWICIGCINALTYLLSRKLLNAHKNSPYERPERRWPLDHCERGDPRD